MRPTRSRSGAAVPRFGVPLASPLPPSFYRRPALRVARDLLGAILVRVQGRSVRAGRIVEVEAYLGEADPASHAARGRTERNGVMYRDGGCLYVYFTYGMHHCANVVTGREGSASAVLLRALEPVEGLARMAVSRGLSPAEATPRMLTGGPARLCQALGIGRRENGASLQGPRVYIVKGKPVPPGSVGASGRIGVSAAGERPWRLFIRGNPCLSRR